MRDDVWTPINERRETYDYEKKLETYKINRMFTSLCKISDKINDLESRILKIENIYKEYKNSEIKKLQTKNKLLKQQIQGETKC